MWNRSLLAVLFLVWPGLEIAPAQILRQLTFSGNLVTNESPAISSDGRFISWLRREGNNNVRGEIWIALAPAYKPVMLSPKGMKISWPIVMSGDGSTVAFMLNGQVWTLLTLGGPPQQVTFHPANSPVN